MSRLFACLLVLTCLGSVSPALAQDGGVLPVPAGAVSAGYVARWHDGQGRQERSGQGWQSAIVFNINRWFGIAGEVSGTYDRRDPFVIGWRRVGRYSYVGGPRFFTHRGRVLPFAQLLVGGQFDGLGWYQTGFAVQPGTGVIVRATERVGVQVSGLSARLLFR